MDGRFVAYTDGEGKQRVWIIDERKIRLCGGGRFVDLSYSDRAFARFVGGDMGCSNPLKTYTFLDDLIKARTATVETLLDKVAREKVFNHVPNSPVKHKCALADFLPEVISIHVQKVVYNSEESDQG